MNVQKKMESGVLTSSCTLRMQVGDICCMFRCDDEETLARLKELYGNFPSDQYPDIILEMKTISRMSLGTFEKLLPKMKVSHEATRDGDLFETHDLTANGVCDLNTGIVTMNVEKHFLDSDAGRGYVNHGLCLVYHTACKLKYNGHPPALIVHSCAVIRNNRVFLFAGPSGVGKTTVARMCGDKYGRVLNDEGILLYRPDGNNNPLMVRGIPIIGELPSRLNVTVPLGAVFLLKQAEKTSARRLSQMEAYTRFMRQVARPIYMAKQERREVYALIAEFSDEVSSNTPFFELEFTLDQEAFWEAVGEAEKSLDKEGSYHEETVG